jgi:putative membrane protein
MALSHRSFLGILVGIFLAEWVILAVNPLDRHDWLLENALVLVFTGVLAASYRWLPLSRVSYALIFVFLCLHEIGAHYTYAQVPYDDWARALTGGTINGVMGWERNHFDRLVHFSYGLLLAYPVRELFHRVADVRGFWGYFLPLDLTMSTSMLFELIEWAAAVVFGGDLGIAYLGTQGDVWDAHKDMGLATLGALVAMTVTAAINRRFQRDFSREWWRSLEVKREEPLGEVELARLIEERRNAEQ